MVYRRTGTFFNILKLQRKKWVCVNAEIIRRYTLLVEFLGEMLGPDYEIALHSLNCKQPCIVAIANGHISGREVGAPLTNMALKLISNKTYLTEDWKLNYRGLASNGKVLRSSTFFIKDERGALTGLLCINFDDSRYRELSKRVFSLCHPDEYAERNIEITATENAAQETFYNSISAAAEDAFLAVTGYAYLPNERLTQAERLEIIQLLDQRGIFMIKGAIPVVAEQLSCSQASVYRYLSKINREKHRDPV